MHVPLVIAAPGQLPGPVRVPQPVSLVDLAPTVLELAGLTPPADYQGSSMLGSTPRIALFFADDSLGILGLRDGPWKFIYEIEAGRARLFDLERDPGEMHDLATREPVRAAWYGRIARGWSGAQKALLAHAGHAMPVWTDRSYRSMIAECSRSRDQEAEMLESDGQLIDVTSQCGTGIECVRVAPHRCNQLQIVKGGSHFRTPEARTSTSD